MIAASEPLTQERALADLRAMLYAAQHARSVLAENGWTDDEVGKRILADTQPWLFKHPIILPLQQLIERCVTNNHVPPMDYYNMLIIAKRTPSIAVGVIMLAHRELPEPDLARIIKELGFE